ncbi:MAG: PLP-dependent aminotransferase family protein, partial [Comamonadaceae bacterium]|nr:PLP-dependent aminotransferase family protein [Comamonadaceae bacterium]
WVELPDGADALRLHRLALAQGISIAPGPIFSASGGCTQGLRLNYGQEWTARTEAALATLGQLAHQVLAPA